MIKVQKDDNNIIDKARAGLSGYSADDSSSEMDSQANLDRLSALLAQLNSGENNQDNNEPGHPLGEIPDELVKLNENEPEPAEVQEEEPERVKNRVPVKGIRKKHDGKSGKNKGPSKKVVILAIVGIIIVCITAGFIAYHNLTTYRFREDATYFVNGMGFDIPAGSSAKVDSNGVVNLSRKNDSGFPLTETGVFFNDSCKMLTIVPMGYYRANEGGNYKGSQVTQLTEVSYEFGNAVFEKNGKTFTQQGEFLHDGNDTYIPLSEASLSVGDKVVAELSPLSYVICVYRNWVSYWDHDSDTYEYIPLSEEDYGEVVLYFPDDHVEVICDQDRVRKGEDSYMLTSAVSMLDDILK